MIGTSVGNFRVIRKLGQGGMGEVLLAEHKDIQTKVAIKMLLPHISADKQHVQRFFNEAVAVSRIKHAGITKIFDVGFLPDGTAYLVMELLEGESLAHRIERAGRLTFDQASDIARQITSVLEATHAEGVIHRDLKPDNIFLVSDAELASGERVKILDFGIAKLGTSGMTQTGGAMGTPTYMSPEQWKNATKVDGRADLYSLRCLVFEMVTGRPPFLAESIGELCNLHLNEPPPAARSLVPDLPPTLDAFVTRLLAKDFQQRPSARETKAVFSQLASDFRGVAAETMLPDGSMPSVKRWDTPDHAVSPVRPAQPTTLGASASAMQVGHPPKVRTTGKLLVGIGILAAAGIAAAVILRSGGEQAETQAAAQIDAPPIASPAVTPAPAPAAPMQRIAIETVPPDATVTIDNGFVANPYDGKFPRSEVPHRLEVRADGYKTDSRWVTFNQHHSLVITLEKDAPVAKPATKVTTKATTPVTTPRVTKAPPVAATPGSGSTAPATPASGDQKPTYKGTKGTIITDYPPN